MNVDPFEFLFGNHSNLLCDESPNSKQDNNPSSYLNFTPPFLDEHELPLNEIFSQNHTRPSIHQEETISLEKEAVDEPISHVAITPGFKRRKLGGVVQGKREGKKKDRHSKICTASGIRDRRMRLSVQVARKFFDLQDMLGYDKASKTIDWLFTKSSQAINQLIMIKDHPPQLQANYKTYEIKNHQVVSCNKSNPNSEEDVINQPADEGTIEKLLLGSSTPSKSCPISSCNNNNQCSGAPSGCVDDDNNNDIINKNLGGFFTNWDTFNYHSRSLLSHDHDDVSDHQVSLPAGEP